MGCVQQKKIIEIKPRVIVNDIKSNTLRISSTKVVSISPIKSNEVKVKKHISMDRIRDTYKKTITIIDDKDQNFLVSEKEKNEKIFNIDDCKSERDKSFKKQIVTSIKEEIEKEVKIKEIIENKVPYYETDDLLETKENKGKF